MRPSLLLVVLFWHMMAFSSLLAWCALAVVAWGVFESKNHASLAAMCIIQLAYSCPGAFGAYYKKNALITIFVGAQVQLLVVEIYWVICSILTFSVFPVVCFIVLSIIQGILVFLSCYNPIESTRSPTVLAFWPLEMNDESEESFGDPHEIIVIRNTKGRESRHPLRAADKNRMEPQAEPNESNTAELCSYRTPLSSFSDSLKRTKSRISRKSSRSSWGSSSDTPSSRKNNMLNSSSSYRTRLTSSSGSKALLSPLSDAKSGRASSYDTSSRRSNAAIHSELDTDKTQVVSPIEFDRSEANKIRAARRKYYENQIELPMSPPSTCADGAKKKPRGT